MPTGYVDNTNDCDDSDANINPDAEEVCDRIDNDCDDLTDDEDSVSMSKMDWCITLMQMVMVLARCFQLEWLVKFENGVEVSDDCDDTDANVNPDAEEICDDVDNNCNNIIDEQLDGLTQCDECTDTALPIATGEMFSGVTPIGDDASLGVPSEETILSLVGSHQLLGCIVYHHLQLPWLYGKIVVILNWNALLRGVLLASFNKEKLYRLF